MTAGPRRSRGTRQQPPDFTAADRRFMRLALAQAERGRGQTRPNPVVGAIIVRAGRIVARGFHHRAGEAHAEIDALAKLAFRARGATLYVNLEPCCHRGRTGPCTRPIIDAGITRVVIGCRDQNPVVDGRGITALRRAGVRVDAGCLEDDCRRANRGFFRAIRDGRPHVTLKIAATLDGFIADRAQQPGHMVFVTGADARKVAHQLRAAHDAVLVGAGTIEKDDPRLDVRLAGPGARLAQPLRVILDGRLRTPPTARIFRVGGGPVLIIGARPVGGQSRRDLVRHALSASVLRLGGAEVALIPARAGRVAMGDLLRVLASRGIQSLLVEGGSEVAGAFIAAGLVDEVAFFIAPLLVGGGVPIATGAGRPWRTPLRLGPLRARTVGSDLLLTADVMTQRPHGRRR